MSRFRILLGAPLIAACLGASCETARDGAGTQYAAPKLVAHRGGTADRPENTLVAIESALARRTDMIWLSVQLSADGEPVLYRPASLEALTNGSGNVADWSAAALARLNAGWQFAETGADGRQHYPYRGRAVPIPTLRQALRAIPAAVPVILDMKAMPAEAQTLAVARVLESENAWGRVLIYSTEQDYQQTFAAWPRARLFESRDTTRGRLVTATLGQECGPAPASGAWAGFEMRRKVEVVETFTLGEGRSPVNAVFWTPASVRCYRAGVPVNLVAFGVNDQDAYCEAKRLGLDAVMVDSPEKMAAIRAKVVENPAVCGR
ncbi:glycerophosphodiester phosphodiesterase family protein [Cupriavidus agavae]|uniref:Glycerophosphoryl diester phosphodiesterase n=1 Tax=Cupriavidus agavae TaxID=1001822 RepID=A0A4Q7S767_9BURK|nr:glycerophosphodiester phosphodiesterase family protein [Cupriavidus agavae]RZT41727.1 glycerophosphoryl diester phosphodiesterase [Cupriavidus agavae]